MKITITTDELRVEINGKEYEISDSDGKLTVYSKDGTKVVDKSKLGNWLIIK